MKTTLRWLLLFASFLVLGTTSRADITGHWSFEAADMVLSAKIGSPMLEADVDTAFDELFGTTGQADFAGVPNIGGQPVKILKFPKTTATGGYLMPPGAAANGGGQNINQYTILFDILWPSVSSGK